MPMYSPAAMGMSLAYYDSVAAPVSSGHAEPWRWWWIRIPRRRRRWSRWWWRRRRCRGS